MRDDPKDSPKDSPKNLKAQSGIQGRVTLPVLPLRDMTVFPHMIAPLFVGRPKSVRALEKVTSEKGRIMLVTQKDAAQNDPDENDFYHTGVIASVLQVLKLPDGTMKVLVEGVRRGRIENVELRDGCLQANILEVSDLAGDKEKLAILSKSVVQHFEDYARLKKNLSAETVSSISDIDDVAKLADIVSAHVAQSIEDRQDLMETETLAERFEKIYVLMEKEISTLKLEKKIRGRVKNQMEKTQREYYLNEQLKAIQNELGDSDDAVGDVAELEKRIKEAKLPKEAREKANSELKKLKQMNAMSAESTVVRNYLDWIVSLPWNKKADIKIDLAQAQKILDEDHYGLEKIKDRIIEYLAVQKRAGKLRGPILCLVGPPGVGKTSLGKSIARATGRQFVRMSLGGVRDEAEIRGHRRTYIGSMPGRIIQSMKKVKYSNPLFLLDEVDKIGADFRGDPAAALLEVLDPEQNNAFADHYLEVEYDLSDVMFITTANTLDIPPALLDRMEIIRLPGYTEDEKVEIARRHLIPKIMKTHALEKEEWALDDEALQSLIRLYTREAGVRTLERELSAAARKTVKKLLTEDIKQVEITKNNLGDLLGVPKFLHEEIEPENKVGIATGMAWTQYGGELLTIESVLTPGKGKLSITGNLRDVMKESVTAAQAYVRARAPEFGIEPSLFERRDIHLHVPEAATPKDGPSAGLAIVTSIVSVATGIPVRRDVSMTGEITLRGRVLPIGGLKEKMIAALRGGVKKILIPFDNVKDLAEIPEKIKSKVEIVEIKTIDQIFPHVLTRLPSPISWDEGTPPPISGGDKSESAITAH